MRRFRAGCGIAEYLILSLTAYSLSVSPSAAIGFDGDDFLITTISGAVVVYDHDLSYKGVLFSGFNVVAMTFDHQGNVVVAHASPTAELRVYDRSGTWLTSRSFTNPELQSPFDIDVAADGHYYVATQFLHVRDFSPAGDFVGTFTNSVTNHMSGVALLPGGIVWTSASPNASVPEQNFISINDQSTRAQIGSISLDHGQKSANFLLYSSNTNTVLIADRLGNAIVERDTSGKYIRNFTADGFQTANVMRGPDGDVFSMQPMNRLYSWDVNGNFLGVTNLAGDALRAPLLWAGNAVPESAAIVIATMGGLVLIALRPPRPPLNFFARR